ncbi:hypothetical protein AAII07_24155 [Microvirga sp. 0TCS3.31]
MNRYKTPSTEEIVWSGRYLYAAQYKIQEIVRLLSDLDAQHNLILDELQRRLLGSKGRGGCYREAEDSAP